MIVFDTDILTLLQRDDSAEALRVRARIAQLPPDELITTTIITYQEQSRGWLAYIAKARSKSQQIQAYSFLALHLENYREIRVLPYGVAAANLFDDLRQNHPRLGTMDLRIAAIALSQNAALISRNLRDFSHIPALRVQDWTK